jgi:hypothetical protein
LFYIILPIWGRRDIHTWSWWGNLKEIGHMNDLGIDRRIILKCIGKIYVIGLKYTISYVTHVCF